MQLRDRFVRSEIAAWNAATGERETTWSSGHSGVVLCSALSRDGTHLATAGSDQTIRLWHTEERRLLRVLRGHTSEVRGLAFSPDGKRLVSASADRTVRLWVVERGEELLRLPFASQVNGVTFSPDGRAMVVAREDGRVVVCE